MSHREGTPADDPFHVDPKEVLAQYSVEWVSLRKSYDELKTKLNDVQAELSVLDRRLEMGDIDDQQHIKMYRGKWAESTEMIQVKREVESRLFEIQREIRAANRQLKKQEEERSKRERMEQERANAMIEWMSLKQGFDLVDGKRREINSKTDALERDRRNGAISDSEYRQQRIEQIQQLAELRTVESDIKHRLAELLAIIRK